LSAEAVPVFRGTDLSYVLLPGRRSADPFPLGVADPCSLRVVRIPRGPRTPHRHPHSWEVVYVAEGNGRIWEGEHATVVGAGDVAAIPPGVPHATVCTGRSELVLVCFFPHPDLSGNLEELEGPVRE
jgi:quercetin dioxygenase-like cupin family protein